jgi:NAD(P)-dependent dehydrogenase (short-subunit alcohol dehydrogenase family)
MQSLSGTATTQHTFAPFSSNLYSYIQLGATVIIASRSPMRCMETAEYIRKHYPASQGTLIVKSLDVSDLDDVAKFSTWFNSAYSHLDILVNNAAVNYVSTMAKPTGQNLSSFTSKQGYDLAFATNYLGPFLLTHLLLPTLLSSPHAYVLQMCSISHLLASPSSLKCSSRSLSGVRIVPLAAASLQSRGLDKATWREAYRNTKLAQILHMKALQGHCTSGLKVSNTLTYLMIASSDVICTAGGCRDTWTDAHTNGSQESNCQDHSGKCILFPRGRL